MQSRLLRNFLVTAEAGNMTEAATILRVSQPALTKSVQQLEADIGVKLFERFSGGVRLTRYGEILLRHVKTMENEYLHAIASIEELRGGRGKALRIGGGPVWLVSLLPPVIARFRAEYPEIDVSLIGGVIDTLLPDLMNGDLDLICVSLDFPNRSEVTKLPLFDVRHVLIADADHPLAGDMVHDANSIQGYPWMVLKSDFVGNERISSFFAANGLKPPHISFETTSIHSLMLTLKGSDCIAHVPEQMLPLAAQAGLRKIELRQTIWETPAGLAYRASSRVTEPMKGLIRLTRAQVQDGAATDPQTSAGTPPAWT